MRIGDRNRHASSCGIWLWCLSAALRQVHATPSASSRAHLHRGELNNNNVSELADNLGNTS
ncbi:MAG: hypothetical protein M5U28_44090, partial [Sandaracinaceae bacterium]|nr:hypothetical protein [Sandaracinaceae bacterium]